MGKNAINSRLKNENSQTKRPYPNQGSQLFFNQKQITPSSETKEAPIQEIKKPVQEINLQTTTDILLAAILQELKTQNMLKLMELKTQQEHEQEELQAVEKIQEQEKTKFEEIRQAMYI
ncbi:coiled-coil protein [Legionella norrlandica]|uniref:Coiled-coil protein n=1 Tax=Legionella norrlandica TaxID=1498499 RepID=A0A0A2SU32_9GAMM|nr:hypothetical protein [Legionella norrlandica]KGP62889.1 coiled-coil protein [Legionella norrlandica]